MTSEAGARPVFLVGFMGCGKTTCGRAVARSRGWRFVDTDQLVEHEDGRTVERIFAESGEVFFRAAEQRALRSLAGKSELVVAGGGGLFTIAENRRWMKASGITVWLDATLEEVRRRIGRGEKRPLWRPHDPLSLRAMFERRRAVYALCHIRVAVDSEDPSGVADRIARQFL